MENIKPYTKYKPSGVSWLGEIPEHWEIRKLKSLFKSPESLFVDGDWIESNDINGSDVKYITTGNIREGKYKEKGSGQITFETFKRLNCTEALENDILISRLNMPIGRCCLAPKFDKPLIVSVDVVICRLDIEYNRKYFVYLMNSKRYQESTALESRGATMKRVSRTILGNFFLSIPSTDEQTTIADFLDYKTAKIDRFIRKKKQLIQLLNEQKAGIINQAVTKGLDASAKMKPSGIEWLGDIPEHWKIVKLRYLSRITTGNKNTEDKVENGLYDFFVRSQKIAKINSYSFDGEGILTAGDGVGVGKVFHYINGKCDYHQRVYLFYNFSKLIHAKFLFYFLQKFLKNELMIYNAKSTVDSVRLPVLKDFLVLVPEFNEQKAIVEHIEKETEKLNKAIATIEKEIALVQEYRTALIAEAVTGKIDVRDYKVPVLEEDDLVYEDVEEEMDMVAEDGEGMEME
ncbi:restriction endonuclease subunit S [Flavobacterium solisilvae]|uniref:Restriction endonuclease subunit S n=1 Tax=Flavobacterium solisilvae TaxID=1852019 RepID=A0ABX1R017_9FLAO|nr:restriction endonuclease subunit S [Flavobacterium solisilvae]NMH26409.1 restriction endonuclease subunit S [Flavobacterium solisilvae]